MDSQTKANAMKAAVQIVSMSNEEIAEKIREAIFIKMSPKVILVLVCALKDKLEQEVE